MDDTRNIPPLSEYLRLREEQLWRELLAIAPDKVRELQGVLQTKQAAESGVTQAQPGPYSGMKHATDAVVAHLRTVPPYTLTRADLERAVLDGGWGYFIRRRALNIKDAIRFRIKHGGILEKDDKLALPEADRAS